MTSEDVGRLRRAADGLAGQLSRSKNKEEALKTAIHAAETSMQALKLAKDPADVANLSESVKRLLDDAERLKSSSDWRRVVQSYSTAPTNSRIRDGGTDKSERRPLEGPIPTRELSRKEKILLLQASFLHGFKFPPWESPPAASEFELEHGGELFLDSQELPLSELQEDVLDDWKRPQYALPPSSRRHGNGGDPPPTMEATHRIDLVQDAATDCSVVASLCAMVARGERGHHTISNSLLCPVDLERHHPALSKNGRYVSRLNFNGCFRKVVIDDRLPTSSTDSVIHVFDRNNPTLLWPALVEKSYLKVRGGYDFPGSNSGTDLWILSGWIPEQVFLQSDDLEPDKSWARIFPEFANGNVLITLGTGKMSDTAERELGLAGEHDYAVLDLKEVNCQRLMLVKNPWCQGTSWHGKFGRAEEAASIDDSFDDDGSNEILQSSRDLLNADNQLSPGMFWMDLDNVLQHFESVYLNWNPGSFNVREDLHFSWNLADPEIGASRGCYASLSHHPQFSVTPNKGGLVWAVMSRHFKNAVPADATVEEIEADRYGIELRGHMSLLAFSSGGYRVLLPDGARHKGWLVDSPQTLLKLDDCSPGVPITLVPAEEDLPTINHTFSLSLFSDGPITLSEASPLYPIAKTVTGAWTKETSGGNAHSPHYSSNPQYTLVADHRTKISLLLESIDDTLNVHVKVVYSKGDRVYSIRNRDIVFDSQDYRRGCCVAEFQNLEAGLYTVICSTFEPQQFGDFSLTVETQHPVRVQPLPREGAGRIRVDLKPVSFAEGQIRVAAPLMPQRMSQLYATVCPLAKIHTGISALPTSVSANSPIRISLETKHGPDHHTLVTSSGGEYSDCRGAIRTEDLDISPEMGRRGDIFLVLERLPVGSGEQKEEFAVELYVDQVNAVASGEWRVWDD